MLRFGSTHLSSGCLLAPMAGISDLPFRLTSRSLGCKLAFTEMISARSLVYQSKKTGKMLASTSADRPLGVQLLGSDPEIILKAVDILQNQKFDHIDFNAACPVGKVTRRGEGSSLLLKPRFLRDLLNRIVNHTDIPVSVKIRSGWDDTTVNARDIALYAEDAGIAALFIHGRTRAQGYRGLVSYKIIREVKNALSIPVIASGDALSPILIKKMFDETCCDGVAIARGSLGNPWIFRETSEFLDSGIVPQRPGIEEIAHIMTRHLRYCCEFHGDSVGTMIFRKFFAWYTKGFPGMKELREQAFRSRSESQMDSLINEFKARTGLYHPTAVLS